MALIVAMDGFRDQAVDLRCELPIVVQPVAHGARERHDKLTIRCEWQYVPGQVSSSFGHTFGAAGWAEAAALTTESDRQLVSAAVADEPDESVGENSTTHVSIEFVHDILWQRGPLGFPVGDECGEMLKGTRHRTKEILQILAAADHGEDSLMAMTTADDDKTLILVGRWPKPQRLAQAG